MWRASVPDPEDVRKFRTVREKFDLAPLVIHTNYLCNLATIDPVIRAKSVASFRGELDRAAVIGAEYLVVHPGNYKGQTLELGIAAFALGLAAAAHNFRAPGLTVLLENTIGGGSQIGSRFEELRTVHSIKQTLGLEHVPIIHTNDSKGLLGSKLDRHQNIGQGHIGEAGFRKILHHPALRDKAFILETPVDEEGDDLKNLQTLKRLARIRR